MNAARLKTLIGLELTQRIRSVAWYVMLGVFALLLAIVTAVSFLIFGGQIFIGAGVYSIVVYFVLLLVVLVSPTLSGNAINGDRDAATLAPVQVTLATTGEIVVAKLLAAWITGLGFLLISVPFLLMATIAGGVEPLTVVASLAVLTLEIGIISAIGVGFSGLMARPLFSMAATYLVVAALTVGTLIGFGLGGAAVQSEVVSKTRTAAWTEAGELKTDCGPWETYTYSTPRFDYFWWMLAANPFVILADATPTAYTDGYPNDLFGTLKVGVRQTQIPPELLVVWDDCADQQWEAPAPPEQAIEGTIASWFVGLGLQAVLAGGLFWGAWARTRTPARKLRPGTRIA